MTAPHDDERLMAMFVRYRETGGRRLRNELVLEYDWIARRCARRFSDRGEPVADLMQVAQIGVVKAVERFDPTLGHRFVSFALPTVIGELRRHFRDTTWNINVPRRSKDLIARLNATVEMLTQQLERPPRVDELAAALNVDIDVVLDTMEASRCYRTSSLDDTSPGESGHGQSPQDRMGAEDVDLNGADLRLSAVEALRNLDERSRSIILWRFYEGCTQSEIGERLGIGQVQVSRLLRSALQRLKGLLGDEETLLEDARAMASSSDVRSTIGSVPTRTR